MQSENQDLGSAGPYRLVEELARGGVAIVYRGLDPSRNRAVAVKRLLPAAAASPHLAELFEREYYTLAQLRHPRIIEVYEYGRDEAGSYYAMELLDGKDLRDLAPLPARDVCRHGIDIASSLALLHARRLLHRDVSPRNVRLTSGGRAKLIDFGGVTAFGTSRDIVGTPPCIAPETLRGLPVDGRADLYALGVVLYFALTGHYPYPAPSLDVLEHRWLIAPVAPSAIVADVPPALDELILSLLRLDAAARPRTASEVLDRLAAISGIEVEHDASAVASYLATPPLVGREVELEALGKALSRAREGKGRAVLVRGPKGSGRSRLVEAFGQRAAVEGALVLKASGHGPNAHAVVHQLLHRLLRADPDLGERIRSQEGGIVHAAFPDLFPEKDLDARSISMDPGERHARLQEVLMDAFLASSERRLTVLIVDGLERCDDDSLGLLAALSRSARDRALMIVATLPSDTSPEARGAFRIFRAASQAIDLRRLTSGEVEELVRSIFADAAHCTRIASWLAETCRGIPSDCLMLLEELVARGLVRHERGSWTLPARWVASDLPSIEQARRDRLGRLSEGARALAVALSVVRHEIDLETCLAMTGSKLSDVYPLLGELVAADVLRATEGGYAFREEDVRERILALADPSERTALHRRAAHALRSPTHGRSAERELEAGYHLLRAGDSTEGADLLARAGIELAQRTRVSRAVAEAIEAALTVYDRERRSAVDCIELLATLMTAGLLVDPSYSVRYGERALDAAVRVTGISLASKLRPFLGAKLALMVGIGWAALRHRWRGTGESFERILVIFGQICMSAAGTAALCLDVPRVAAIERTLRPLASLPESNLASFVHRSCRLCLWSIIGRHRELIEEARRMRELLERNVFGLSEEMRRLVLVSPLVSGANRFANDGRAEALAWADALEALDLKAFDVNIAFIRQQYHAMRGDMDGAERHRVEIERIAVRGGSTWQAELFAAVNLAELHLATEDGFGLRMCERAVARDVGTIPSLAPHLELLRAAALRAHGGNAESIALYERAFADQPISTSWLLPYADYGRALLAENRVGDARRVLAWAVEQMERIGTEGIATALLPAELARAEAMDGDFEHAIARVEAVIEAERHDDSPVRLAVLHQARARIALMANDVAAFEAHRDAMHACVARTTNAGLIAALDRLNEEGRALRVLPSDPNEANEEVDRVNRLFDEAAELGERARIALELLVRDGLADGGYLFGRRDQELECIAQLGEEAPPPWLESEAHDVFERLGSETSSERTATVVSVGDEVSSFGTSAHLRNGFFLAALVTDLEAGGRIPAVVALRTPRQALRQRLVEIVADRLIETEELSIVRVA